jgi:hypothetical protein
MKRRARWWHGSALALAALGCGGRTFEDPFSFPTVDAGQPGSDPGTGQPGSTDAAVSGTGDAGPGIGPDPGTGQPGTDPLMTCGLPVGQLHQLPTEADFRALFGRTWLSCGQPSITHDPREAGFVAQSGGTYQILVRDASGRVVPDGRGGTFKIVPNAPSVWQVDFAGAAGALKVATITDAPRRLSMNEIGVFNFVYVPADTAGWIEGAAPQPERGTYVRPTACSLKPGPPHQVASAAEMRKRLVRSWSLCSPTGLGPEARGQAGIEIRADGRYNVLVVDTSNRMVAATDVHDQGRWDVVTNSPPYEVTFSRDDGSAAAIFVELTDPPVFASMNSGTYLYTPID